jgi:hypothetical protein
MIYQRMYFFNPFNCDEALDDVIYLEDTLDDNFFIEVSNINKIYFLVLRFKFKYLSF